MEQNYAYFYGKGLNNHRLLSLFLLLTLWNFRKNADISRLIAFFKSNPHILGQKILLIGYICKKI